MKPLLAALLLALGLVSSAGAQPVADHLKCYKVRDPQAKITYTAELDGLVPEPGCRIKVPAAMACVPAIKTISGPPFPPGGGGSGTPNGFFCYKVKCPKTPLPPLAGTDQFGSRTVTPSAAKLLCAPLAGPTTTTTTTTTSTTSTTTTTTTTSSTTTTTARFVDNGDGTVTDNQTGLQWEKKVTGSGCPHCVNDVYSWSSSGTAPDGTAFTSFLATLNGGATGVGNCVSGDASTQTGGFNNQCDWRLPTIAELRTIVDCSFGNPCIDPIFGPTTCTICGADFYLTSTTRSPAQMWGVDFRNPPNVTQVNSGNKTDTALVRAVRGGS